MHNEQLTAVVHRLWTDERFLAAFRRDPARAVSRYGLTDEELDAVKGGDESHLAALGADVRSLHATPPSLASLATGLLRPFPRVAAMLLAAHIAFGGGAPAAARGRRARGSRMSGRARTTLRARSSRTPGLHRAARAQYTVGGRVAGTLPIEYDKK
jgi:hypothetical protein